MYYVAIQNACIRKEESKQPLHFSPNLSENPLETLVHTLSTVWSIDIYIFDLFSYIVGLYLVCCFTLWF